MEGENKREKKGGLIILLICGILGLVLMIGGSIGKEDKNITDTEIKEYERDPDEYAKEIEEKVVSLCSGVEGVKNVRAIVTLKGGYRTVYAINSQSSGNGDRNELVTTGSGSGERAVAVGYENPEIAGIGIVCDGGNNSSVKLAVTELVSSAFGISANKISVAEANK